MEVADVERIARTALRELGVDPANVSVAPDAGQPGVWRIEIQGNQGRPALRIKCGSGTTPQWVREQIFQQYLAQS